MTRSTGLHWFMKSVNNEPDYVFYPPSGFQNVVWFVIYVI